MISSYCRCKCRSAQTINSIPILKPFSTSTSTPSNSKTPFQFSSPSSSSSFQKYNGNRNHYSISNAINPSTSTSTSISPSATILLNSKRRSIKSTLTLSSQSRSLFTSARSRQSDPQPGKESGGNKGGIDPKQVQSNASSKTISSEGEVKSEKEPVTNPTPAAETTSKIKAITEDIRTIPNLLTLARIASTPFLGYMILTHDMKSASILLFFAGFSDLLDGYLARKWKSYTVFGSIADPAADKILMTTMVVCLAKGGLMPVPLAVIILGRDVALIISAFIIRFKSLPPPRTFSRYWDFTLPSASVHPTTLSKYNTFLQLLLVGSLTVLPICPTGLQELVNGYPLDGFMILVATTTILSGLSYLGGKGAKKVGSTTSSNLAGKMKSQLEKKLKEISKKKE